MQADSSRPVFYESAPAPVALGAAPRFRRSRRRVPDAPRRGRHGAREPGAPRARSAHHPAAGTPARAASPGAAAPRGREAVPRHAARPGGGQRRGPARAPRFRTPAPSPHPTEFIAFFVNWDDTSFTSLKQNVGSYRRARARVAAPGRGQRRAHARNTPPRRQEVLDFCIRRARSCGSCRSSTTSTPPRRLAVGSARRRCSASPAARAHAIDCAARLRSWAAWFARDQRRLRERAGGRTQPTARRVHVRAEAARFQPRGLQVSQSVPLDDPAFDYKALAATDDYLMLMAYDEHAGDGDAGPGRLAGLVRATASTGASTDVPAEQAGRRARQLRLRLDRRAARAREVSFQEAVRDGVGVGGPRRARRRLASIPTFDYSDESQALHHVWFLDGVTRVQPAARGAPGRRRRGSRSWRLGSEDPSIWSVFEHRSSLDRTVAASAPAAAATATTSTTKAQGEVLRVTATPREGSRALQVRRDHAGSSPSERLREFPSAYVIERRGAAARRKQVALTFDDGPDPRGRRDPRHPARASAPRRRSSSSA